MGHGAKTDSEMCLTFPLAALKASLESLSPPLLLASSYLDKELASASTEQ